MQALLMWGCEVLGSIPGIQKKRKGKKEGTKEGKRKIGERKKEKEIWKKKEKECNYEPKEQKHSIK